MSDHLGNHASASSLIESLEQRRFLSATLDEGVLAIVGTHKGDSITVGIDANAPGQASVRINGFLRRFALTDIEQINIQAGQGNDFVQIDPGKRQLNMPTRIYGSGGDDTLIGGYGKDRIYGGSQNDRIFGNSAHDILYGEAGQDTIDGGNGSDAIFGGVDNDNLTGGPGIDTLVGDDGNDFIEAKDGATDSINGGLGVDTASFDKADEIVTSIEHQIGPES